MNNYRFYFAQAYGDGTYSTCIYNNTSSCASGTSGNTGSSQLTNTGFDIFLIATLACFLIFVALATRLWRKKRASRSSTKTQPGKDDHQNTPTGN